MPLLSSMLLRSEDRSSHWASGGIGVASRLRWVAATPDGRRFGTRAVGIASYIGRCSESSPPDYVRSA